MDIHTALNQVNDIHVYTPDEPSLFGDSWDVDPKGDCEDYSFAVLWRMADKSRWGFVKKILSSEFSFWHVKMPDGEGHFVTEMKIGPKSLYFDNIYRTLMLRSTMEKRTGYQFSHRYPKIQVLLKLALT